MTLSQQLREAGEKATPGEWEYSPDRHTHDFIIHQANPALTYSGQVEDGVIGSSEWIWIEDADAALIVLLRNNLDTIIAALEAQEAGK
jgi:hypothetical protein